MSAPGISDVPALVVLEAGASARLGRPKALVTLREGPGGTALELLLAAGACLGDARPLVVTGADHAEIAAHVARLDLALELCEHRAWSQGRSGSMRAAAERRRGRDLCLAPVDVPLVPRQVFAALVAEWQRQGRPARGWLGPFVARAGAQLFGHPVLLGRDLAHDLQVFPPDRPLARLRACAGPLLALEVECPEILDDLDTPADLARLRARSATP